MKLQSCLMIQCIVPNTIDMQELFYNLENYIKKYFPKAIINLKSNEPYWKYPDCNKVIYNLLNDQFITISEFIKYLLLSWHYKSFDNGEEDAIWNQNCYPEEVFLMPKIEWVHIYTWKEDENVTIN